jgi:hypothetical protein
MRRLKHPSPWAICAQASVKFAGYSLCETAARVGLDARKNVKEFLYAIAFEN